MNKMNFEFDKLVNLLRRSQNDPEVREYFGRHMLNIEHNEYYGFLEFKPHGVSVVFQEAPWVLPAGKVIDLKELFLAAFHLHRKDHEGYDEYAGQLPKGITLGDSEAEVLKKMGQPSQRGGGNISPILKQPVAYWLRYSLGMQLYASN